MATTHGADGAPNPAVFGQSITFTATVTPAPTGTPAGTVSFYNGSTLLGTGDVNSSGVATFTSTSLSAGALSITAVYSGNAAAAASTSSETGLEVATTLGVTAPSTPFTVKAGGAVDIDITVPPLGGAFDSVVIMSASGLPAGATATFTPPTVVPGASGATTVSDHSDGGAHGRHSRAPAELPVRAAHPGGRLVHDGRTLRKRMAKSAQMLLLIAMLAGGTLLLTGCNGGFAGSFQSFPIIGQGYQRDPACFHYLHPHREVRTGVHPQILPVHITTQYLADKDKSTCGIDSIFNPMHDRALYWLWDLAPSLWPRRPPEGAPVVELGADYNYVRANAPPDGCGCFSMHGANAWFAV